MSEPRMTIALTPTADVVRATFTSHILVVGQTNSGKSSLLRNLLLEGAKAYGNKLGIVIIDPKQVGFLGWKKRADIYTRQEQYIPVLTSIRNEMQRRYKTMVELDISQLPLSEKYPRIVLVIDELAAFMNSQPTKSAKDELSRLLLDLVNQGRQANITVVLSSQTIGTDVIPSSVRSGFAQRLIGKLQGSEQISMASAGREEECRSDLLYLPGEMFALTTETFGQFIRCKSPYRSDDEVRSLLDKLSSTKPTLKCLDWTATDYLG